MYTDINTYYIFICLIVEGLYNIPAGPAFCTGFPFTRGVKGVTGGKGGGVKLFIKLPYAWSSLFKRGCQGGAESEKIRVHELDTAWEFGHSCVELEGNCTVLRRKKRKKTYPP